MQRLDFIRPISDVSSNGLDGFYLPVEEECADEFLNSSMDVLGSVAFELASSDQALADALWLIKPYLGLDAATIFFNAMQLTVLQRDPANRSIQVFLVRSFRHLQREANSWSSGCIVFETDQAGISHFKYCEVGHRPSACRRDGATLSLQSPT